MNIRAYRCALGAVIVVVLHGCVGHAAQRTLPSALAIPDECRDDAALVLALPPAPESAALPLLAAVSDEQPSQLVVYDMLEQRRRWQTPLTADSRPELLGDLVVTTAHGELLGFDALSGAPRMHARLPHPTFIGAARLGSRIFFVSSSRATTPDAAATSALSAVDLDRGTLAWTRELPAEAGRPQVASGHVLVLLTRRDLLVLDAADGEKRGCTRLARDAEHRADWLRTAAGAVLYGGAGARKLVGDAARGSTADSQLRMPLALHPAPPMLPPDDTAVPGARSAHGRVALLVDLESADTDGGLRARGGRFYFVFFRALFAFNDDGTALWARTLDSDVARAQTTTAGLTVALESGALLAFDGASGAQQELGTLGRRVASADLPTLAPEAQRNLAPSEPLDAALTRLASIPDTRLLPARELAIDALSALPDAQITCDLLDVYAARAMPPTLQRRVAERLRTRASGADCLLRALASHADFLSETPPPALPVIVPVLVAQHEKARAVPLLVDHLFDPQTPLRDLALLVDAIDTLGEGAANDALARFVVLYHRSHALADDPLALVLAVRAIHAHGTAAQVAQLNVVMNDDDSLPALVAALTAPAQQAPAVREAATDANAPPAAPALPETLDDRAVADVFSQHANELRTCVQAGSTQRPELQFVRLAFVVAHDGRAHALRVLPEDDALDRCLQMKLQGYLFPAFRAGSRAVTYQLVVRPPRVVAATSVAAHSDDARPFWWLSRERAAGARAERTARRSPTTDAKPWWQNENPLFLALDPVVRGTTSPATTPATPTPATPATSERPKAAELTNDDAWWTPQSAAPAAPTP